MPRAASSMASVPRNGGIRSQAITQPLKSPTMRPARAAAPIAANRPKGLTRAATTLHRIARAVADGGTSPASEVGQHKLACLSFLHWLAGVWIKKLSDKFAFIHMNALLLGTGKAKGTHLCHACVVVGLSPPCLLNTFTGCWDRGSWFTSMDGYAYARIPQVHIVLLSYFC